MDDPRTAGLLAPAVLVSLVSRQICALVPFDHNDYTWIRVPPGCRAYDGVQWGDSLAN